ncbi:LuxR C-terminal-related transcriptional regulator [Streptomyces sp. CMB-StM0423]|uniref:LuxR C-terminal-related transcriptional regulator n=1 Tax=Streptomyces sp. CMB-StM0423 TaxID=2059884 RepID=UPI000C7075EC|nr:LuxR C-terminal-related transcriptional regulator [Streptomyces sp. CMB-StM0423]AUH39960.1 LuxR family transcriptional regulator [Streptomyces sp. CMB-StM0423]
MTTWSKKVTKKPETIPGDAGAHGRPQPGPVHAEANEQFLSELLGADLDDELRGLAAAAGENGRLLAELAYGLVDEGLVTLDEGTVRLLESRTPRCVPAFVKLALGELSPGCQELLKIAALQGRSFLLEDVSRMLNRPLATLLAPLDEAMSAGFVAATERQFVFRSDFLRRGAVAAIPAPARGALQREAMHHSGRSAEETDRRTWVPEYPAQRFAVVAEGDGGPYSRAHGLIMKGKVAVGTDLAQRTLTVPGIPAADRLDAEASALLGGLLLGREEEAGTRAREILGERTDEPDDVAALMALTALSHLSWRAGDLAEGIRLGRAAVRYCGAADPLWRLHIRLELAAKLIDLREYDEAEALVDEAEAGLYALPSDVWHAAPAALRARLFLASGRFRDARRHAELVTAATDRNAVPALLPFAYAVLAAVSLYTGDLPTATDHLERARADPAYDRDVRRSPRYAWTDVRVAVRREGPRAGVALLSGAYDRLPAERRLYVEDPAAAAFLVRLALDTDDDGLRRTVLDTVNGLAGDNPGISVVSLSALHANAVAERDASGLAHIVAQSPDPISIALATEELARLHAGQAPARRPRAVPAALDATAVVADGTAGHQHGSCWVVLSDMERRIAYLVSVGMTNRQIARRVHLSAHTVNYHLRKIYKKLGIGTRVELAREAATYSGAAAIYSLTDDRRGSGPAAAS